MITEPMMTFAEYADADAQSREPLDLPTREEVEAAPDAARFVHEKSEFFRIDTEDKACWVLRRMASVEAEAARVKSQATARLEELANDARALHNRFDGELEAFARLEADRRKRKTVTLLDGTLTLRTAPARFVIADGREALNYALANTPRLVMETITQKLDEAEYKARAAQHLEATGELFPGVDRVPECETFSVKFPTGKGKEAAPE